ncbi:acyltransferase [Vibrio sonorensis]|uniref:acyltransferase n=1 Tax=Vibrio sonorensis TaxID=1004316 RepID=UPI0008DACE2A|nr:acyltransferase [Vibrio sonorensis]
MNQRELAFDLMRCVAAVAVIAIHVLAPYRQEFGVIPFNEWNTAIAVNGASRWAVPVFILISGALLLNDPRPFQLSYYLKRRLFKVLIPFIIWSLFYALFSGLSAQGYDSALATKKLMSSHEHATYYHLGFFYYFIPLYFLVPFFHYMVKQNQEQVLKAYVAIWLVTSLLYLLGIDGLWSNQMWLYSGYLPLGYLLYQRLEVTTSTALLSTILGLLSVTVTVVMVVLLSHEHGEYTVGRWLSYKTFNVVVVATAVFILCRFVSGKVKGRWSVWVELISRHSLGIYLLHPIFLWPMKTFGWYQGHPMWVIPVWVVVSGAGALLLSVGIARQKGLKWLLP